MKIKCLSVRLKSLDQISAKCFKATGFDGISDLIPISQVFGIDYSVSKSDAYWISEWILKQKKIQHSNKKAAIFDNDTGKMIPIFTIEKHIPKNKEAIEINPDASLIK